MTHKGSPLGHAAAITTLCTTHTDISCGCAASVHRCFRVSICLRLGCACASAASAWCPSDSCQVGYNAHTHICRAHPQSTPASSEMPLGNSNNVAHRPCPHTPPPVNLSPPVPHRSIQATHYTLQAIFRTTGPQSLQAPFCQFSPAT